jgi:hypothetical protein
MASSNEGPGKGLWNRRNFLDLNGVHPVRHLS